MNDNGVGTSTVIARHDYLPFGEETPSGIGMRTSAQGYGVTDTNRWKYGMLERDSTTGLDHTWWRKYESTAGRWTSPDPMPGNIGDPQSFNQYSYTRNDPVNFVDPTGLFLVCFIDISSSRVRAPGVGDRPYITVYTISISCYALDDRVRFIREPRDDRRFQHPQKPREDVEKPCITRTAAVKRDINAIARTLHGKAGAFALNQRFPGGQINPRGQSFQTAVSRLTNNGFVPATILGFQSFDHPEGDSFQKQFSDSLWYHVVVNYPKDGNPKSPTPLVTAHCHATDPTGLTHIIDRIFGP